MFFFFLSSFKSGSHYLCLQKFNSDVLGKVLLLLILVRVHWISEYYKLVFSILFVKFPFIISAFSFFFFLFCLMLTLLSSQDPKYMYIILLIFTLHISVAPSTFHQSFYLHSLDWVILISLILTSLILMTPVHC